MALGSWQLHSYIATQLRSYPTSWEICESLRLYESKRLELGPEMALGWPWMDLGSEAATQPNSYTAIQLPHELGDL